MTRRQSSTDYVTDTVSVTSTSYGEQTGSNASYTVDQISNSEWGLREATAPSVGQTLRVTQFRLVVYYKRVRCTKTIKDNLRDTYIVSGYPSDNYGGDTVLYTGRDTAGNLNRIVMHVDSSDARTDFTDWIIDTAKLYIKTAATTGAAHKVYVYSGVGKQVYAGTSVGSLETGATSWNSNQENIELWGIAGIDSSDALGGRDRTYEPIDSFSVAAASTWYSVDVRNWFAIVQPQYVPGTLPSLPLIIWQSSESAGDSTIRYASENNGTSGNRPYIYMSFHPKRGFAGSLPAPGGASADSIVLTGDGQQSELDATALGAVSIVGMRKDSGVTTYDKATLSYTDVYGASGVNYWGLRKDWSANQAQSDWTVTTRQADILFWRDAYRVLSYYGIGDRASHGSVIDSVIEYVKVVNKLGTGLVQLRVRGPVLQRPQIYTASTAWTSYDTTMNVNDVRDSIFWKGKMASGKASGRNGALAADWDTLNAYTGAGDSARWDVGYYTDIVYFTAQIPAAGAWLAINRTTAFKAGLAARCRWELGGGAVDSIGFGDVFSWQSEGAVADSFATRIDNTRIWFGGVGTYSTCCGDNNAPRLVIYLNAAKTQYIRQQYGTLKAGGFKQDYNWVRNKQRGAYGSVR
jgi:hypothetical protein